MKILVTGSAGFTGRHLVTELRGEPGLEIFGVDFAPHAGLVDLVCDLTVFGSVTEVLQKMRPQQIYNLAGSVSNNYDESYRSNVVVAKNLLDSLSTGGFKGRLLLVGSSAEYGLVGPSDLPVKESQPLNPVSMYGLTKVYQTYLMKTYRTLYDLDVVMVRPFNLLGKGMSENLFAGSIEGSIDAYKRGRIRRIEVGNLDSRRDYIQVGRAVKEYALVMRAGDPGEIYNVGSGASILMRDLLKDLLAQEGLDMSAVLERPGGQKNKIDIPDLYADISKLSALRTQEG